MRILVTGATGQLGAHVLPRLIASGHEPIAWSGTSTGERSGVRVRPVDLGDEMASRKALDEADPAAILHLAAVASAAVVLDDPVRAEAVNVGATAVLADWSARRNRRLVYTSTDLVFDGSKPWNLEDDPARPVMLYGRQKLSAERPVLAIPGGLVARLPLMFGPSPIGRDGLLESTIAAIRRGEPRTFFEDEYRTPLDYATASRALVALVTSGDEGLLHVAGAERVSRYDLMRRLVSEMALDASLVRANRQADAPGPEPRPADASLDTTRLMERLPDLERPSLEQVASTWS